MEKIFNEMVTEYNRRVEKGCSSDYCQRAWKKVVENYEEVILRPKVVGLKTGRIYDLAGDLSCANIIIL